MYRHKIPVNVTDNGNFGNGYLKKRNTIEAAIIIFIMFLIFKYLLVAVPLFLKTVLFTTFALMPALIALIGIGDESVTEAIMTYRRYSKMEKVLPYSLTAQEVEEEKEKPSRKERREAKKAEKREKKAAKATAKVERKTEKIRKKTDRKIEKRKKRYHEKQDM